MRNLKRFRMSAPSASPTTFPYSAWTPRKRRCLGTSNGRAPSHAKDSQKPATMISRPFLTEQLYRMASMMSGQTPDISPWGQAMTPLSSSVTILCRSGKSIFSGNIRMRTQSAYFVTVGGQCMLTPCCQAVFYETRLCHRSQHHHASLPTILLQVQPHRTLYVRTNLKKLEWSTSLIYRECESQSRRHCHKQRTIHYRYNKSKNV